MADDGRPGLQITLAVIALLGVLGGAVIANWDKIHGSSASSNQPNQSSQSNQSNGSGSSAACTISGLVFNSDSNNPLSSVEVDVHQVAPRPPQIRAGLATTGPDGKFAFDCSWIDPSQYPVILAFRHRDWVATMITGPKIQKAGHWENINIPISMSHVALKPYREVDISYGSRQDGGNWFIVGEISNTSDQPIPCLMANFSLSSADRQSLGILPMEIKNLGPHEKRSYEKQLPQQAGFYMQSKSDCP